MVAKTQLKHESNTAQGERELQRNLKKLAKEASPETAQQEIEEMVREIRRIETRLDVLHTWYHHNDPSGVGMIADEVAEAQENLRKSFSYLTEIIGQLAAYKGEIDPGVPYHVKRR